MKLSVNLKRVGTWSLVGAVVVLAACQSELPPMPGARRSRVAVVTPEISNNPEAEVFTVGPSQPLIITELPNTKDEKIRVRTIVDPVPAPRQVITTTLPATRPGVIEMVPSGTQPGTR